jgi:hypothetical protein
MSKGRVIVRHKVRDFDAWKPFFIGDAKRQHDAGVVDQPTVFFVEDIESSAV